MNRLFLIWFLLIRNTLSSCFDDSTKHLLKRFDSNIVTASCRDVASHTCRETGAYTVIDGTEQWIDCISLSNSGRQCLCSDSNAQSDVLMLIDATNVPDNNIWHYIISYLSVWYSNNLLLTQPNIGLTWMFFNENGIQYLFPNLQNISKQTNQWQNIYNSWSFDNYSETNLYSSDSPTHNSTSNNIFNISNSKHLEVIETGIKYLRYKNFRIDLINQFFNAANFFNETDFDSIAMHCNKILLYLPFSQPILSTSTSIHSFVGNSEISFISEQTGHTIDRISKIVHLSPISVYTVKYFKNLDLNESIESIFGTFTNCTYLVDNNKHEELYYSPTSFGESQAVLRYVLSSIGDFICANSQFETDYCQYNDANVSNWGIANDSISIDSISDILSQFLDNSSIAYNYSTTVSTVATIFVTENPEIFFLVFDETLVDALLPSYDNDDSVAIWILLCLFVYFVFLSNSMFIYVKWMKNETQRSENGNKFFVCIWQNKLAFFSVFEFILCQVTDYAIIIIFWFVVFVSRNDVIETHSVSDSILESFEREYNGMKWFTMIVISETILFSITIFYILIIRDCFGADKAKLNKIKLLRYLCQANNLLFTMPKVLCLIYLINYYKFYGIYSHLNNDIHFSDCLYLTFFMIPFSSYVSFSFVCFLFLLL